MPNTASSKKRVRQTEARTLRNKTRRTKMRTLTRMVQEAVAAGDKKKAEALLPEAYKAIDKAAKQSVLHANTAAHQKSKLAKAVGGL